jgi:hypothetical protein
VKHIVCFSGGHSSALVAIEVRRKFPEDTVVLLNHDIDPRSESSEIKDFKVAVASYLSLPITYANAPEWDRKDQFDVVIEAGAFKVGNGTALCTNRMKTKPFEHWLKSNADPLTSVIYYGFDGNEHSRIQRRSSHLATLGYRTDYPLALWKERTVYTTEEVGIARPSTYSVYKHANCTGCLKAGKQHWYVVFCTRPDIWEKAKYAEDEIGYTILREGPLVDMEPDFIRLRNAGVEATEHMSSQKFWSVARTLLDSSLFSFEDSELPCECIF